MHPPSGPAWLVWLETSSVAVAMRQWTWLYPAVEIAHIVGFVTLVGAALMFGIHGDEHEITVPAQVELAPDHWSLTVHFKVPYVKWGMKDPSTFVLRVDKTVAIDLRASGSNPVAQR